MWIPLGTQPAKIGRSHAICIEPGQERIGHKLRKSVIGSGQKNE